MKSAIKKQSAFLKAFKLTGSITEAAAAAKIDRGVHYDWLRDEPGYKERFEASRDEAVQTLEDAAVERARKGVYEPIVYQGEFQYQQIARTLCTLPDGREVYREDLPEPIEDADVQSTRVVFVNHGPPLGVWKKSDALLMFLLKALRPEKYRERVAAELTGPNGGPIELRDERLKNLTDDQLADLIRITRVLAADGGDRSGDPAPSAQ